MSTESYKFHFAGYSLDPRSRQLLSPEGELVALSSRAFDTLLVLIENRGETLSKTELLEAVWPGVIVEENNLNQAISSIRRALGGQGARNPFIQTIPGRGYCFVGETTLGSASESAEPDGSVPAASAETPAQFSTKGTDAAVEVPQSEARPKAAPAPANLGPSYVGSTRSVWRWLFVGVLLLALVFAGLWLWSPDEPLSPAQDANTERDMTTFAGAGTRRNATLIDNSIAVLPFTITDNGSEDTLFAIGLQYEIINQLTKIDSLNVISQNSVQAIVARGLQIREIGELLRVESILTGHIIHLGDRARVSLEMLDPATGIMMWSDSYETDTENLDELVSVHSNIALSAAQALEAEVNQQERQALASMPTSSVAAYRYNIAARNAYFIQDFEATWTLSRQALALDPEYYDALYHFASVNTVLIGTPLENISGREHYRMALESAEAMTRLQPERTEGYALKAAIYSTNKEWIGVSEQIEILQSINASPSDLRFLASVLMVLGDVQGAIDIFEANLEVEPVNFYARGFLMMAHELAGNRMQARQEYELGEELSRLWWGDTVNIFLSLGRRETLQDIDELQGLPDNLIRALQAVNAGNLDNVRSAMQSYLVSEARIPTASLYFGALAAYLGDHEQALVLVTEAVREVWLNIHWLWLPVFDEVRKLPGFRDLMVESGLVDYWQTYGWPEMCRPDGDSFNCDWSAYPGVSHN